MCVKIRLCNEKNIGHFEEWPIFLCGELSVVDYSSGNSGRA